MYPRVYVRLCTLLLTDIFLSVCWTDHMYTHSQAPALPVQFLLSFSAVISGRLWVVLHVSLLLVSSSPGTVSNQRITCISSTPDKFVATVFSGETMTLAASMRNPRFFDSAMELNSKAARGTLFLVPALTHGIARIEMVVCGCYCIDVFRSLVLLQPLTFACCFRILSMGSANDQYRIR